MVRVEKVAKYFGGRVLFEDVTLPLEPRGRVGLVGPNGAGKTTLFHMIAGYVEPDAGRIIVPKGVTVGHLPQDVGDIGTLPLVDYVLQGREEVIALHTRLEALTAEMQRPGLDDAEAMRLAEEMGEVSHAIEAAGGYDLDARARSILSGMGFPAARHEAPASTLSGGWRVRLVLARLLLQRPDVLLLDEPTNHLDVPSVEWLEGFLDSYEGTVVVISHDRYFLNRLVTSIAALEPQGLHYQPGNYDEYEAGLAERIDSIERARARQDRELKHLQDFIDRFRSKATKAKQVQSRVKALEKVQRIDAVEQKKTVRRFAFAEAPREGKEVSQVTAVRKAYGAEVVYQALDFALYRGDRVVLVGPNGQGKTTLLKIVIGAIQPDAGTVQQGHNVLPAYFGQHQVEELDLSRTLLEEMEAAAPVEAAPRCRSILGSFLFSGEDVDKKIAVLSGGERNRLALAKLLLRPTNLLVLDEPTNHLDMDSRDVLLEALAAFGGTILFVSHDRYFINGLASRVVHVEAGTARSYDGDYDYYRAKRAEEAAEARAAAPVAGREVDTSRRDTKRRDAELRARLRDTCTTERKKLDTVEKRIAELEARSSAIGGQLADPEFYGSAPSGEVANLTREYQGLAGRIEAAYGEWTHLSETIERAEARVRAEFGA
ncbi:MAG: ABC-F family ATP-binding cassette domain-containing protein [Myxococcales bacterium]|nr:ABC-F family ATP-binding cassette domain-containing protein [Myxococcales bacterium]MCB9520700.1 ABC-F family ATP-binding cassette domain-containing protein [Myxococcales bacterium]MCB9532104.1 ABC-F family ATP-binding cassette domain-containing protein [Myxococcales bacterium]